MRADRRVFRETALPWGVHNVRTGLRAHRAPARGRRGAAAGFLALIALCVLTWGGARSARAHQSSVVYAELQLEGRDVEVTLQIASTDLYEALGLSQDRPATRAEAEAGRARIAAYLLARITVANHGLPCPGEPEASDIVERGGPGGADFSVVHKLRYACQRSLEEATVTYGLFFELDPRHQGLAHVRAFGTESEHVFRAQSRTLTLSRALGAWDNVRDYLALGIEHIFTGYDHLAFLFGLLIIAGGLSRPDAGGARPRRQGLVAGLRYVVGVVTAFTLAHSVTLVASALGWVALPGRLVESVIAASIAYVAVENMVRPAPRHRFALTFCFGLVHGFGFASVLREIGLPRAGLLASLLSFNLGVELGQLVVVALAYPVLHVLASRGARASRGRASGLEAAVLLGLSLLCAGLLVHFGLPVVQVGIVTVGGPLVLWAVVPRLGYDRAVRIGCSAVLLAFALLWLFERAAAVTLLRGALG